MTKAESHKPLIYPPPGRCPSWSPGNELKCTGEKGHEGLCRAVRVGGTDKGEKKVWEYRLLDADRDRMEAAALGKDVREELETEKQEKEESSKSEVISFIDWNHVAPTEE